MSGSADNQPSVKPRLLDLFCGAGGAAMGYHWAGFEVVGVDINPQPDYPFEFHQDDALALLGSPYSPLGDFAAIHASPPCQDHSPMSGSAHGTGWMLDATIDLLRPLTLPWVVENVVGSSVTMRGWWFVLCGSSFGLPVRRHRRFRSNALMMPPGCRHGEQGRPWTITGHGGPCNTSHSMKPSVRDFWRYMDMPWMEGKPHYGVAQAIPPAYTEWIGRQLLAMLERAT